MNAVLETLGRQFFQVGYVVCDLDSAIEWFRRTLEVAAFHRFDGIALGAGCRYRGQPADSCMDLAIGYLGDVQVEIIAPRSGPSIYAEFLSAHDQGLHHLGFSVSDFAAAVARLHAAGLEPIADGRLASGTEFAYFDCSAAGASCIEVVGFDPATAAFMARLRAAARA
jgi:catechol 2,3-dioxygenase-like lactoylglutathione lyase family enzyme